MRTMRAKTTDLTTQLRDRCLSHFATLRLPVEAAALDELLTRAEKESFSHLSFLDRLLGAEANARRERAVARRIREARFAENKTLEGFDWNFNPKTFDRVQLEELATGDFIRRRTNLVMVGWSGIGKSHVIQALGQKACVHGYRVLYQTSAQLLADLTASLADKTLPVRLHRYASPDLLIIDEFGYLTLKPEQGNIFFKLMEERYHCHSTIITTNLVYDEWHNFLGNKSMVDALLSRVRHYCHTVTIDGPSLRELQG